MTDVSISLGQMHIKLGRVEDNLETAEGLIADAARQGSDLVLLPELWSTGYDLENAADYADALGGGMFAQISELASQHQIAVCGSILERRNGQVMNCASWHAADGEILAVYRKIHLFRLFDEHKWLGEGETPVALDAPWGDDGTGDLLRFALSRALSALRRSRWRQTDRRLRGMAGGPGRALAKLVNRARDRESVLCGGDQCLRRDRWHSLRRLLDDH